MLHFPIIFQVTVLCMKTKLCLVPIILRGPFIRNLSSFQIQILGSQAFQKIRSPQAICQRMKHLQVNPVPIIGNPEKKTLASMRIQIPAGIGILPLYPGDPGILLKVIPEQAPAQLHPKIPDMGQNILQRLLQNVRIHRLLQSHRNAKYLAHLLIGNNRENFRRIIQSPPTFSPFFSFHEIPHFSLGNSRIISYQTAPP